MNTTNEQCIDSVRFTLYRDDEVVAGSAANVEDSALYDHGLPKHRGVNDALMGYDSLFRVRTLP